MPNINTGTGIRSSQVSVTGTAISLAAATNYRNAIEFTNTSTTGENVWIGPSGVTASTGHKLVSGASKRFDDSARAAWFGITAGGTAVVTVEEELAIPAAELLQ